MTDRPERPEDSGNAVDGMFPVDEHFEEVVEGGQTVRHKGIYILPNLFTTGNLFCGFLRHNQCSGRLLRRCLYRCICGNGAGWAGWSRCPHDQHPE